MNLRRLAACALPCLAPLAFAAALLCGGVAQAQTMLSANLAIRAPGSDTTATWSGAPSPSGGDWLGLFAPGAPNWAYVAWRYTSGTASGSVPFTIPSGLAHGTYELRFLSASQGHVATSNPITVSMTLSGTITLSGSGLAAVSIAGAGATCTESNSLGQYACAIPSGWSGTLTPAKTGHAFSPASRNHTNVTASQAGQGYTASLTYQLSGTVTMNGLDLANVAMAATNGASCTDSDSQGHYTCTVLSGWTGTVTPSQTGYSFSPSSRNYSTPVAADDPGEDYTASLSSPTSNIAFIHVDHLNTPRLVANAAGQTVWRWDQAEPFGNNPADENPSGLGAFDLPLRLPGQYYDRETALHYNYFRNYDPTLGRYEESDPLGLRGGLNTYLYVLAGPLLWFDPKGLNTYGSGGTICPNPAQCPNPPYEPTPEGPKPGPQPPNKNPTAPGKCHPIVEYLFNGCTCADTSTNFITCMACCKTVPGFVRSGGGTVCQQGCKDKYPAAVGMAMRPFQRPMMCEPDYDA